MKFHFFLNVEDDVGGLGDVVDIVTFVSSEGIDTGVLDLRLG